MWTAPIVALGLFVCAAGMFRLRSTDVFWHLAAGRWILEHGQIPTTDPFRFTSGGAPWVDHEWLFQLIIRGVELAGGVSALVLFRSLLALVLAAVLYRGLRQIGTNVVETVLLVLFSVPVPASFCDRRSSLSSPSRFSSSSCGAS